MLSLSMNYVSRMCVSKILSYFSLNGQMSQKTFFFCFSQNISGNFSPYKNQDILKTVSFDEKLWKAIQMILLVNFRIARDSEI